MPKYLVVTSLGLKDTIWALIPPPAISAFNLVVICGFFPGIPPELLDSARVDGASDFRILVRIVLPLSKVVVAASCPSPSPRTRIREPLDQTTDDQLRPKIVEDVAGAGRSAISGPAPRCSPGW